MAATIGATSDTRIISFTLQDVFGEIRNGRWEVAGAATDAEIEALLDDYKQVSNAGFVKVTVTDTKAVTGLSSTASNALERVITAVLPLEFKAANPVNPSSPFERIVKLRAPDDSTMGLDGLVIDGVTPNLAASGSTVAAALSRITGFFEAYAIGRPSETDALVTGEFIWDKSAHFYTETGVMNGNSLD